MLDNVLQPSNVIAALGAIAGSWAIWFAARQFSLSSASQNLHIDLTLSRYGGRVVEGYTTLHNHGVTTATINGVELLLESWGGESAYFWQRDPELQLLLKRIGRPRVLEIAMPLCHSRHSYSATEAVVATYGRMLGAAPVGKPFDLFTHQPLGPEHILAVHSEGDPTFAVMARGYPSGYVDMDLG